MSSSSEVHVAAAKAEAWKHRHDFAQARAFAAQQRELAAAGRSEAAGVREEAALIRSGAALVRDDGARTRDDAARVRDSAAVVRDHAARARDLATRAREEATRRRLLKGVTLDRAAWEEILKLDAEASDQSRAAATHDREAATLDRTAAAKDHDAAERDRTAATTDRTAADRDRIAADKDCLAADADRAAADSDRRCSEHDLAAAEERLTRADRLAAMGRLAAGVAHEINNPLAALMLTLSTMDQALVERDHPELARCLSDARLATEHIARVVSDMKTWLHGDGQPAREAVDVAQLITESVRLTARDVSRVAKVVLAVDPLIPVWGVRVRLGQVLINLLLNASQAFDHESERNVVRITARMEGTRVHLEVQDTGHGIATEVLPHLFDPFFTTREGSGGSGLGLSTCERIISDHGGTLTVHSTPGEGATFSVELPGVTASAPLVERTPAPGKARLLLIDDDAALCRSLARLLSSRCDVTVATNGQEGLEQLTAPGVSWDVVLCDLMMPVMNGLELYRRLLEVAPRIAADLVFISGGATTTETAAFLARLSNVQLQKPFETQQLFDLIEMRVKHPATK